MKWFPSWPDKDPDETVSFRNDWSERLGTDMISTSTFTIITGGVIIQSQDKTSTLTSVTLSGGTEGEICEILNRISTTDGQTFDQTVLLRISKR